MHKKQKLWSTKWDTVESKPAIWKQLSIFFQPTGNGSLKCQSPGACLQAASGPMGAYTRAVTAFLYKGNKRTPQPTKVITAHYNEMLKMLNVLKVNSGESASHIYWHPQWGGGSKLWLQKENEGHHAGIAHLLSPLPPSTPTCINSSPLASSLSPLPLQS